MVKHKKHSGQLPPHPKKHHKPFRVHHVGLFALGVLLIIASVFGIGFVLGKSAYKGAFVEQTGQVRSDLIVGKVRSSLGFQFNYNKADLQVSASVATSNGQQIVSGGDLDEGKKLDYVFVKPKASNVTAQDTLTELEITTEESAASFETFKTTGYYQNGHEALIKYYAPEDDSNFNYELISQNTQKIGGIEMARLVYKQNPKASGLKPVYKVIWAGVNQGRPVKIELKNLVSRGVIPIIYNQIFQSLQFGVVTEKGFEPLFFNLFERSEQKPIQEIYDINGVSPAVVKIYHVVCGKLIVQGKAYGSDVCDVATGSGFLVSADGYIATNGHVVTRDAPDILVSEFLNNPRLLAQFAASAGLSAEQTARSDVIASLLAKLYDLPPNQLSLKNRQEKILVALGDKPLKIKSQKDARKLLNFTDGDFIKNAEKIAVSYNPKDLLVIEQGTEHGFSASDVALLKAQVQDAPFITLADSLKIQQNAPVNLVGFPDDADNQLTANNIISPTITAGTVNSIRQAKGNGSRLFQTDADASQGSSGGPAISANGEAFGILTYRFKDNNIANAAKSYIRDISDFKGLLSEKNITLNTDSTTQKHWERGLVFFSQTRYSKALDEFAFVLEKYPAHRLARSYATQAQLAIRDGKDLKETNYSLLGLIYGGIAGFVGIVLGAALIAHHHRQHHAYKQKHAALNKPN